jgi:hypothetical protein
MKELSMTKHSIFSLILLTGIVFSTGNATALDAQTHMGAICGFADNPLVSHNRTNHRFQNTSGVSQWISCPVPRDQTSNSIEYLAIEIAGTVSNVRFEVRAASLGSLTGFNAEGTDILTGGARYEWFVGSTSGSTAADAAYAFEAFLSHNAAVSHLHVTENN